MAAMREEPGDAGERGADRDQRARPDERGLRLGRVRAGLDRHRGRRAGSGRRRSPARRAAAWSRGLPGGRRRSVGGVLGLRPPLLAPAVDVPAPPEREEHDRTHGEEDSHTAHEGRADPDRRWSPDRQARRRRDRHPHRRGARAARLDRNPHRRVVRRRAGRCRCSAPSGNSSRSLSSLRWTVTALVTRVPEADRDLGLARRDGDRALRLHLDLVEVAVDRDADRRRAAGGLRPVRRDSPTSAATDEARCAVGTERRRCDRAARPARPTASRATSRPSGTAPG